VGTNQEDGKMLVTWSVTLADKDWLTLEKYASATLTSQV
jgi:hypothetical protein